MHLTPRERERLLLAAAADLARRRLARGARLGATEAVALVCDEACEMAWDGIALEEVIERARQVIAPESLLPGVAGLVPVIEVEALFPWGTTLVHIDAPFPASPASPPERPGAVRAVSGDIELAAGAERRVARLRNTGPRDVWISSHFPLSQVNPAIEVAADRPRHPGAAAGLDGHWHLDLPAGEALLLRAGEERAAAVVAHGQLGGGS
jgi:urease subunit gamma/beta